MSIQLAAKHLAAHGRGPDTTLVHMTPGEVASLQSLAQQHGGSLSINPQTGLPEAGFLSALLPMAAGAGLAAMGMPAGYAALSVGAASALTNGGDLKQGLMNGISAYGGADMATSFMGAGLGTMGGSMGTSAAAPATVLEAPVGGASPYALTGSSAAPSAAKYSLGESSSFLNQSLPSLVSTAPAEVAKQAATLTPAAQAAQQSAALNELTMGQRWDALKAGATGTNAMNYIKANPFTSLGVATAAMTPDETSTPQKAADTDRGPRAKLQYYPGYGTSLPKPNMQGIEQTYNRPYYAAEGGVAHMAEGGIASAPRNQQQLFADYLARVSGATGAGAGVEVAPVAKPEVEVVPETPEIELPFLETPVASNTRGGGGEGRPENQAYERPSTQSLAESLASAGINYGSGLGILLPGGIFARTAGEAYKEGRLNDAALKGGHTGTYTGYAAFGDRPNNTMTEAQTQAAIDGTGGGPLSGQAFGGSGYGPVVESRTAPAPAPSSVASILSQFPSSPQANGDGDGDSGGGMQGNSGGNFGGGFGGGDVGSVGNASTMSPGGGYFSKGGISSLNQYDLGSYSDGGRLLKGPGDGVSDSIPATIGKGRPARLADGEFVIPARIVSEIGNGSTEAGARKLYAMMDRIQAGRKKSVGKGKVAVNSRADKHLPA